MENFSIVINECKLCNHKYQQILYEQYRGYAFKIVFRYIYQYEDAATAVNDGFVKLLNNINKFEPEDGIDDEKLFMGWLKKIMINIAIDHLRKNSLQIETITIPDTIQKFPDTESTAHNTLFYNDLIMLVRRLPPAYRLVFNLHVIDGYSHPEIAEIMNIPVSTSRSNLLRARTLLQNSIIKTEENQTCQM